MSLFALKIERTQDLEYLTKERFCSICKNLTTKLTGNNPKQSMNCTVSAWVVVLVEFDVMRFE